MNSPVYTVRSIFSCPVPRVSAVVFALVFMASGQIRSQVLTCPNDYSLNVPQNLCGIAIYYDSLTWSSTIPLFDPVYFPFPGTILPTGVNTITLATVDGNDNFHTCDFEVTVLAYQSTNFTCPNQVVVSLNGQCERDLNATDILGVTFNPCDEDYTVEILDENNDWVEGTISAAQVGQTFNVRLTNFETNHSCETLMSVSGGEPSSITCPANKTIRCNEPTDSSYTGAPLLTGCFDNVDLYYDDEITVTQCPDSIAFQISRSWVAVSPNGTQVGCVQNITAKRFKSNLVQFPPDYDGVGNPALSCNDSLNLTATAHPDVTGWPLAGNFPPDASTHCKFAMSYIDNITNLCGDAYRVKRVWTVVNTCNAQTRRDTQTIMVLDNNAPFFEIPDTVFFSLSGGCVDSVFLPSADVTAECSAYNLQISSAWGNFSVNGTWVHPDTTAGIYPVSYKITDACGNDTTQVLTLKITDETLISCPPNDTVDCNYYYTVISPAIQSGNLQALASLGQPSFYLNCDFDLSETDSAFVNGCGVGQMLRTITATNASDTLVCVQNIQILHLSDFVVQFPPDTSLCTSPAQVNLPDPVLSSINCEQVSVTFSDMIIPSGLTGCYTIMRTWVATNTCAYVGTLTGTDEELAARRFRDNGDGYVAYTQTIRVNNNAAISFPLGCEIPDLYVSQNDCTADILVPTPTVNGCGSNIALTVSGSLGTVLGAPVGILPGQYNVTYKATDDCGKQLTCSTSFAVFDTVAPVAVCKTGLEILQQPPCQVDVISSDLLYTSPIDNCSGSLDVSFSPTNPNDFIRTYNSCDGGILQLVDIWVTDDSGNQNHCQASFTILNVGSCGECLPMLGGKIKSEVGQGINNVSVDAILDPGIDLNWITGPTGNYEFDIDNGVDVELSPKLDINPANGVTTFDMVVIRKHILGVDTLNSPYKIIAADVNNSKSVTTFDMVEIRKLILQVNTDFPANTSWRFVDAAYVFPNPMNPFQEDFPETITVNDVTASRLDLDFIGIKIGDVNGSADVSLFNDPNEEEDD